MNRNDMRMSNLKFVSANNEQQLYAKVHLKKILPSAELCARKKYIQVSKREDMKGIESTFKFNYIFHINAQLWNLKYVVLTFILL
jgi:hypothetical protein